MTLPLISTNNTLAYNEAEALRGLALVEVRAAKVLAILRVIRTRVSVAGHVLRPSRHAARS